MPGANQGEPNPRVHRRLFCTLLSVMVVWWDECHNAEQHYEQVPHFPQPVRTFSHHHSCLKARPEGKLHLCGNHCLQPDYKAPPMLYVSCSMSLCKCNILKTNLLFDFVLQLLQVSLTLVFLVTTTHQLQNHSHHLVWQFSPLLPSLLLDLLWF